MANVKLVIEIDEEWLKDIKERIGNGCVDHEPWVAIANGTPLPKGHGRLIDADEAIKTLKSLGNRDYRREKGTIQEAVKMLDFDEYTPTIIEADKE